MKAYSTDLRQKIIEAYQRGQGTQRAIAELFGVSVSFVEKLLQRYRTTGHVAAKAHGGGQKRRLDASGDQHLRAWIRQQPDLTLAELRAKARQELGVTLGLATLWRALKRLGLTRKKRPSRRAKVTPNGSAKPARTTALRSPRFLPSA